MPLESYFTSRKIKDEKKEVLFSELFSLLSSGLDFSRSFELLIAGEREAQTKTVLQNLYTAVIQGNSLWIAFERSGQFTALDCGVLRIGEETGRLANSLSFLTDYYCKKIEQRKMVSSAVSYPLVILFAAAMVVTFMVLVIVPMFEQVYSRMGGELPALTRWIIEISKTFPYLLAVFVVFIAVVSGLLIHFKENRQVRQAIAALLLKIPIVGAILKKKHQSHFCKLLHLLTGSGVPLLHGIGMLPAIITFYPYQQSFLEICRRLERGELFAASLARYPDLYDIKLTTLVRVAEETNRLPEMLRKQGEDLTKELEYKFKYLGTLLEPVLILTVGVLVAIILVAMYLPMFKLGDVMS